MRRRNQPQQYLTPSQRNTLQQALLLLDGAPFITAADVAAALGHPKKASGSLASVLKALTDRGYLRRVGHCYFKLKERVPEAEPHVDPDSIIRPIPKARLMAGRA